MSFLNRDCNGGGEDDEMENMMLDVGNMEDISFSTPKQLDDYKIAISNRDSLIKR